MNEQAVVATPFFHPKCFMWTSTSHETAPEGNVQNELSDSKFLAVAKKNNRNLFSVKAEVPIFSEYISFTMKLINKAMGSLSGYSDLSGGKVLKS